MESEHIEELKKVCEEIWEEIQEKHGDLKRSREVKKTTDDTAYLDTYRERERKLRAEIEVLKRKEPQILPTDKNCQREILVEDLTRNLSQLKETLSVISAEKSKIQDDIQRESELGKQLEAINIKLQEKVENTPTEVNISQKRYIKELKDKEKEVQTQQRNLLKLMATFLGEHFPLPTQTDIDQHKKRPNTRNKSESLSRIEVPVADLLPLHSILEMLMNKCLETPHDAYVMIDERFWQPYITVLLRCNIALRHPEDDRRIRLVPFHL